MYMTEVLLKRAWSGLSYRYQYNQDNVNPVVKKVYFFWICPDTNAFEWFTDLLQYLEERVSDSLAHALQNSVTESRAQ